MSVVPFLLFLFQYFACEVDVKLFDFMIMIINGDCHVVIVVCLQRNDDVVHR